MVISPSRTTGLGKCLEHWQSIPRGESNRSLSWLSLTLLVLLLAFSLLFVDGSKRNWPEDDSQQLIFRKIWLRIQKTRITACLWSPVALCGGGSCHLKRYLISRDDGRTRDSCDPIWHRWMEFHLKRLSKIDYTTQLLFSWHPSGGKNLRSIRGV